MAFETEGEAIEFTRTKNPNFGRDIQNADAQASARMLLDCTNRLNARGKTIKGRLRGSYTITVPGAGDGRVSFRRRSRLSRLS
jgi:hypothetical protein